MPQKKHPGVYIPPPVIFIIVFLFSILLQKIWPLDTKWLHTIPARIIGALLIGLHVLLIFPAIRQFFNSKNTLVTIKPATSLQTTGIYAFSRNPMYLALVCLYVGIAAFLGNGWTLVLLPLLVAIIHHYVIKKEERYLQQEFGQAYEMYRRKVRRWF